MQIFYCNPRPCRHDQISFCSLLHGDANAPAATEVLSAGVPVLTLPGGKPHSSRVASSVVLGLGLPELVARTMDDYEDIAGRLVSSRRSLELVKGRLGAVRDGNRLFDKRWWADGLERCYGMLWDVAMAGEGPMHVISASGKDHQSRTGSQ